MVADMLKYRRRPNDRDAAAAGSPAADDKDVVPGATAGSCHDMDVFTVVGVSALTRDDTTGVVERYGGRHAATAAAIGPQPAGPET